MHPCFFSGRKVSRMSVDAALSMEQRLPTEERLLKTDATRFVEYKFASVETQDLVVGGNLMMTSIVVGNPLDGATVNIPSGASFVILQSTAPYVALTLAFPSN